MSRVRLRRYNKSKSGRSLSRGLGVLMLKNRRSKFRGRQGDVIINWGNRTIPSWVNSVRWINHPINIANASNKLRCFSKLDGVVPIPEYTQDRDLASTWLLEGFTVMCRTTVTGNSGKGIVVAKTIDDMVDAPLYTKFIDKDRELRVHVINGRVVDWQEKKKRQGEDRTSEYIWNYTFGSVFVRNGVVVSEEIKDACVKTIEVLGLDFGAVDVITKGDKFYILEVNTSPALSGTTLDTYVYNIKEML